MTSSSENKFYCADVWSNMSVCPSICLHLFHLSVHPSAYLSAYTFIPPSFRKKSWRKAKSKIENAWKFQYENKL